MFYPHTHQIAGIYNNFIKLKIIILQTRLFIN